MSDIIDLKDPTAHAEINAAYAKLTATIASWTQHGGHNMKTFMHRERDDLRSIARRHGISNGVTESLLTQAKAEGQRRAYDRAKAYADKTGEPLTKLEQQPIKNDQDRYPDRDTAPNTDPEPEPEPDPESYHLLVDSVRGIYAAQHYAMLYGDTLSDEDREILLAGPDNEHYLEVWDNTLDGSITIIISGKHYAVKTDNGDIWAVSYEEYLY